MGTTVTITDQQKTENYIPKEGAHRPEENVVVMRDELYGDICLRYPESPRRSLRQRENRGN